MLTPCDLKIHVLTTLEYPAHISVSEDAFRLVHLVRLQGIPEAEKRAQGRLFSI